MRRFLSKIKKTAKKSKKKILLPESLDERILKAAQSLHKDKIITPVLLGDKTSIERKARQKKIDIKGIEILSHLKSDKIEEYTNSLYELRKEKGLTKKKARNLLKDMMYYSVMLLYHGEIDGIVSGAIHPTAHTIKPALQIIKTRHDVKIASSFFFMILDSKVFLFSDCGFVIDPSPQDLAEIAIQTADSAHICNLTPKVAMLSFSTKGSAKHPMVDKVVKATKILKSKKPNFIFDGELQLDAAIVPKVAKLKDPNSPLKGDANVLIFPSLDAGNIGYKLVQRLAGAEAIGPIIQGLNHPVNDLSRGCDVNDIICVAIITAIQSQFLEHHREGKEFRFSVR